MKRWLLLIGRLILAGIFLYAGYAKLREPWVQFAGSLYTFRILPDNMLEPVARILPWCEVALGLAILSGVWLRWFALISSLVLIVFLSALTWDYLHGIAVDCGCFGKGEALGPVTLLRDSTMLLLALAVTVGAFRKATVRRAYLPRNA